MENLKKNLYKIAWYHIIEIILLSAVLFVDIMR